MEYIDYRELHRDTINKLHQMVNSGKITVETACSICADFVPESIKEDIITYLSTVEDKELIPYETWIAWLEKQGENNMGISEATKQELEDNLNKALEKETPESCNEFLKKQGEQPKKHDVCDNCDQQGSCVSPCPMKLVEKQGEQKPVFEMKTPEESLGIDFDTYNKIVDECVYGEQKPAWGEEDKDFMYDTLSNLTELKDRYGEGYGNVGKCIDWLKSLKERYTWKPSYEQMKALNIAMCGVDDPLFSLYQNLKKLKG